MAPNTAQGLRITLSIMSGIWPVQNCHLLVAGLNGMSQLHICINSYGPGFTIVHILPD